MGTFGWKSPFPLRFGGNGHSSVEDAFVAIRANVGDALSDEEGTATVAEDQAAARILGHADRAVDRYAAQGDPARLTQLLERWEAILAITPSVRDSLAARRRAVASRIKSNYSGTAIDLSRLAAEAFSPWTINLLSNDPDTAQTYWPGGTTSSTFPWYSTVCLVCVEYKRPAYASDADAEARRSACMTALEEHVPAWCAITIGETPYGGTLGFYLDKANLNLSVFGV